MYKKSLTLSLLLSLGFLQVVQAQPPGVTMEMIMRQLPLEGAPLAIQGEYETIQREADGLPGHIVIHPTALNEFPVRDNMPLMVWGNGGCAIDGSRYADFLSTIASHGFLVMTTVAIEGQDRGQASADDMFDAIAWAEKENERTGSPLYGKIDLDHIAAMGQSCGGFMSATAGLDPRVGTVGLFNSGLNAPSENAGPPGRADSSSLAGLHGPVLLINGGEVDFMYETAQHNFDVINHVPVFYGARENAGHTATVYHPGGGEFANVASNWLRYVFKNDRQAGRMFVGNNCSLCTNENWETDSKDL